MAGLNVTVVRDKFSERGYHIFVPADREGVYWTRWTLDCPDEGRTTVFAIHEVWYGIVRPGRWMGCEEFSASLGVGGTMTWRGWRYRVASGAGAYLEYAVPDGHNRLHLLLVCVAGSGGVADVRINGQTAFTYDTGQATEVVELKVTSELAGTGNTVRVLSMGGNVRIIGVHTFDDDGVGDPAEAEAGLALGHDLVDRYMQPTSMNLEALQWQQVAGQARRLLYWNTVEFTLGWRPAGQTQGKWTALGAHYGDQFGSGNNADFTATTPSTLLVDGSIAGAMHDAVSIPCGAVFQGCRAAVIVEGYGDYDRTDGTRNALDVVDVRAFSEFTDAGAGITNTIVWSGDAVVTGGPYVPSVPIDDGIVGSVSSASDRTKWPLGLGWSVPSEAARIAADDLGCLLCVAGMGPVQQIAELMPPKKKAYVRADPAGLPGGATPAAGDVWSLGGRIGVFRRGCGLRGGQTTNRGRLKVMR